MAKNMRYENALHISVTAPYDVESGAPVAVGLIRGVAIFSAKEGERVTVWLDGSWMLEVSDAVDEGDAVFIDGTGALSPSGTDLFGVALETTSAAGPAEIAPIGYASPASGGSGNP